MKIDISLWLSGLSFYAWIALGVALSKSASFGGTLAFTVYLLINVVAFARIIGLDFKGNGDF